MTIDEGTMKILYKKEGEKYKYTFDNIPLEYNADDYRYMAINPINVDVELRTPKYGKARIIHVENVTDVSWNEYQLAPVSHYNKFHAMVCLFNMYTKAEKIKTSKRNISPKYYNIYDEIVKRDNKGV